MAHPEESKLFHGAAATREAIVERFEEAWATGRVPTVEDFLPADGPLRCAVLIELVHTDLECRLKAGEPARVEVYLQRFPELAQDTDEAVELILAEFRLRARQNPAPRPEEFLRRFPDYQAVLAAQLAPAPSGEETTPCNVLVPVPTAATRSPADLGALPADLRQFLDTLRELQALGPDQFAALVPVARQARDLPALAAELVRRGWLTSYQVDQLRHGRKKQLLFGPYLLLEPLGQGGMGQVFKARHRVMKRVVALKIIRKGHLPHGDAVKRFQQEIESAAKLVHPNIVTAFDAGRSGDYHFLVMEYVAGVPLDAFLKKQGPLPVGQACEIIRQAALGLQHAHERGLVHRDIKPSNLILASEGREPPDAVPRSGGSRPSLTRTVKILDMGLARVRYDPADKGSKALTQMGAIMGTADYIAPEQILDCSRVDGRADVYSLGCTLYELLTGQPPFPGGSLSQKLDQHLHAEPRPASEWRPGLPPEITVLLRQLLAKQPGQRYASADDLAAALVPFCTPATTPGGADQPLPGGMASSHHDAETILETPPKAIPVLPDPADSPRAIPVTPLAVPASPALRWRKHWLPLAGAAAALLLLPLLWLAIRPGTETENPGPDPHMLSPPHTRSSRDRLPPPDTFTNSIGMKLKRIPAGKFLMGSPTTEPGHDPTEEPQHLVTITHPFYLGICEVTVGQFRTFMQGSGHIIPKGAAVDAAGKMNSDASWESPGSPQTDEYPVVSVSWEDAQAFCAWLSQKEKKNYRLPTEAEWEYACRAGTTTKYSFGDDAGQLADYAWYQKNSQAHTQPVASKKPNPWGLYDMHGNAWEWCADHVDGTGYAGKPEIDPQRLAQVKWRGLRGGGWNNDHMWQRSAARTLSTYKCPLDYRGNTVGFRIVCEAEDQHFTTGGKGKGVKERDREKVSGPEWHCLTSVKHQHKLLPNSRLCRNHRNSDIMYTNCVTVGSINSCGMLHTC